MSTTIHSDKGEISMSEKHKAILKKGNAAITEGNYEGFLELCSEDTEWEFVGDKILKGKAAVREWMATEYQEPPQFRVAHLIAEGDFLTAMGEITLKDENGTPTDYSYCDVWRFRGDEIVGLKAFVIETGKTSDSGKASDSGSAG